MKTTIRKTNVPHPPPSVGSKMFVDGEASEDESEGEDDDRKLLGRIRLRREKKNNNTEGENEVR